MADFTPVALGVKPPQGMSLGDMLNIANSAQAYQQAQQINPLAVQKAQEDVAQARIGTNKAQLENMLQHTNTAVQGIQTLMADKDLSVDKIKNHVKEIIGNAGGPETAVTQALIGLPEKGTQAELRAYLAKKLATGMSTQAQLEKLYPASTMVNTGNQQVPVQMGNQMLTGITPGTPQGLGIASAVAPASQETLETDPLTGNAVVVTKDPSGKIVASRAAPAAPAGGGFNAIPAGETKETAAAAKTIQLQANKAASNVQQSQFNNNTIIGLADKALVGSNAETLAKLGGGFAVVPWSSDATDNRQKLGHQLALETANLAAGAGLNTDAARALGEKMSGDITWTPEAIKSTARMNRALTTGTDMFNRGINAAVEKAGNSPFAAREFQNKWSTQEQLVPTLQFVDALRNAKTDPAGAQKAIQSVGGYGSDGYKEMLKRAGKLNDLITKGQ